MSVSFLSRPKGKPSFIPAEVSENFKLHLYETQDAIAFFAYAMQNIQDAHTKNGVVSMPCEVAAGMTHLLELLYKNTDKITEEVRTDDD